MADEKRLPYYVVNAFTSEAFSGNPAGVCLLDAWIDENILQRIARWNRLSETAFVVKVDSGYEIRWFTPEIEMDLCGHATLATGFVLRELNLASIGDTVRLKTKSVGGLEVSLNSNSITLNFPVAQFDNNRVDINELSEALGAQPIEVLQTRDTLAVFETTEVVRSLAPDFDKVSDLDTFAVIATAPGEEADFVSRYFAPSAGVNEDPVTGSAHCTLTPYWAKRLGKSQLTARQISDSPGSLVCELEGDRVLISGSCTLYSSGEIRI